MDGHYTRRAAMGGMALIAALPLIAGRSLAATSPVASNRVASTAALLRTAFPHNGLAFSFYTGVATRYLGEIDANTALRTAHDRGLLMLDDNHIAAFADLPDAIQTSLVHKIDQEGFFKALLWRGAELVYRDPQIWDRVGFEGSSLEYGGYKERGFDDIDWLPKTEAAA